MWWHISNKPTPPLLCYLPSAPSKCLSPRASDQGLGRGINIQSCIPSEGCTPGVPSAVSIIGSLVEDSHELGLFVGGSEVSIEVTVVRRTWPQQSDQRYGRGE